ncbi:MAG: hypothetical protein KA316_10150 [Rhodoferax sp.]|mgnify:FL=1|nr:hypothetical protein [Rhodoferax sp.]HQX59020.1 hypothetical protein [Burkholderiaceae bacterium]
MTQATAALALWRKGRNEHLHSALQRELQNADPRVRADIGQLIRRASAA